MAKDKGAAPVADHGKPTKTEDEQRAAMEAHAQRGPSGANVGTNGTPADKPTESKAARFKRLGNKRLPKALKALAAIQNLANTAQYERTPEQTGVVLAQLRAAMDRIEKAFGTEAKQTVTPTDLL